MAKTPGRPKKTVDWARVDELLMYQCDGVEIAADQGMHPNTFYLACQTENKCDFSDYSQQKRTKGIITARETFFKEAFVGEPVDKNRAVRQIFWLKNHAGMVDKQDIKHSGEMGPQLVMYLPDNGKAAPTHDTD